MELVTNRIKQLIKIISHEVYEKEIIFELSMLAFLSGESIFLLGKPGIAKSLVARRMKHLLKNGKDFEYLMNRFSTPEEIFGPISIKELLDGEYKRIIENYLPSVDIAFLDEIWKAGPSIQNTLLTIINEKIFRNGAKNIKVPLKLLISASNELPESGKGLEALFDRFIIRMIVTGLNNTNNFNSMLQTSSHQKVEVPSNLQITNQEYNNWQLEIEKVVLSKETLTFIARFRTTIYEVSEGKCYISDRRWKKIARLIKTSAFFEGRKITTKIDLLIIPYCIWNNEQEEQEYTKIFNQCFVKELSAKFDEQENMLQAELETLNNVLANSKNLKHIKVKPSVYKNVFNSYKKGNYHRIIWDNTENQIAFIDVIDYTRMINRKGKNYRVKVYYGNSLNQIQDTNYFMLYAKSDNELVNLKDNNTYFIEMQDFSKYNTDLTSVQEKISIYENELKELPIKKKKEFIKLKKIKPLFFNQQYQLLVDLILNDSQLEKINEDELDSSKAYKEIVNK